MILKLDGHDSPGNCAIMINDQGEVVHRYVKMNPWIPTERHYPGWNARSRPAQGIEDCDIVCADGDYPRFGAKPRNGANIIVRPTHYMSPWENGWDITNKMAPTATGAMLSQSISVGVEAACSAFGMSMIVAPDGNVMTKPRLCRRLYCQGGSVSWLG